MISFLSIELARKYRSRCFFFRFVRLVRSWRNKVVKSYLLPNESIFWQSSYQFRYSISSRDSLGLALAVARSCKSMQEFCAFVWTSSCSNRVSVVDAVVDDVVQERSKEKDVDEDVPFRDILVFVWGLPVQL